MIFDGAAAVLFDAGLICTTMISLHVRRSDDVPFSGARRTFRIAPDKPGTF
jgi:hypothetical protein